MRRSGAKECGPAPSRTPQHLTTLRVHAPLGPRTYKTHSLHMHMQLIRLLRRNAPVACLLSTQRELPSHAMLGKASKHMRATLSAAARPATDEMSATGGARLARRAKPPVQDSESYPERAVQLTSAATPHKPIPGHHSGSPHRIATKSPQTARIPNGHCLDITPNGRHDTDTQAPPSATPQTPEPPAHAAASEKEAVGGMRCCGGVLKRGKGKQKAQQHPNAKPTPQTPEPPAHITTSKTKWRVACGAAGVCRSDR